MARIEFRRPSKEAAHEAYQRWFEKARRLAEPYKDQIPFRVERTHGFNDPKGGYCLRVRYQDEAPPQAIDFEPALHRKRHTLRNS